MAPKMRANKAPRTQMSVEDVSDLDDDVVVYWYSFSNHYTKRAFTQP